MSERWSTRLMVFTIGVFAVFGALASRPTSMVAADGPDCSNLIINGGFESPQTSPGQRVNGALPWSGNYIFWHEPGSARSGTQHVELSGGRPTISQYLDVQDLPAATVITVTFYHDLSVAASLGTTQTTFGGSDLAYKAASLSYTVQPGDTFITLELSNLDNPYLDDFSASCDPADAVPTPSPTLTPTIAPGVPLLTLNGEAASVTVPINGFVDYAFPTTAQVALWQRPDCAGTPDFLNWRDDFDFITQGFPRVLWTQARLRADTDTKSPCFSMTWAASPTNTPTASPTSTPTATSIPTSTATNTPSPTETNTPEPTATNTPEPTVTNTPEPTATNTPVPTATNTPEPTATNTPEPTTTIVPTNTLEPTVIAPTNTAEPTSTTIPTNTTVPTSTTIPTNPPEPTETDVPTEISTEVPTEIPVSTATNAPTLVPTAEPTQPPATTGQLALTLTTVDGGPIPDTATICVEESCGPLGDAVTASAASGTTLLYDLPAGSYLIAIRDVSPYADRTGEVSIADGATTELTLQLSFAAEPTAPGNATPIVTETAAPTTPAGGPGVPSQPGGGAPVTGLPNTGTGRGSSGAGFSLLLGATLVVIFAGVMTWRRRTR